METILIVDDEKEIADLLEIYLKNENYKVLKYYKSEKVLQDLENLKIDLAILDIMMPEMDGFSLCTKIREKYNFPILFLSAKTEDISKISGLQVGADDYITKPFEPLEVIARIKAQLRRYKKYNSREIDQNIIDFRGILMNKDTHTFYLQDHKIDLTPTEFSILWTLCENRGKVVESETLLQKIWKEKYLEKENNTIMVHIRHLREKMNDLGKNPKYIKTVWGIGYKVEE